MNIALERLLEGIIATLRNDVIPHVGDAYARGQAVGVIDLINNIGPRIEWARAPLMEAVSEKIALLADVAPLLPGLAAPGAAVAVERLSSAELSAERDRLDAAIGDALALAHGAGEDGKSSLTMIVRHLHGELTRAMKTTRKPLFAEIASGREEK
jgi:hypothetical protein